MAYVQADLIREVLVELLELEAGESASTEDSTAVTNRLAGIVADLAARRITGTISLSAIAEAIFPDLVKVVAQRCADLFGRPSDEDKVAAAETRLAAQCRRDRGAITSAITLATLEYLDGIGKARPAVDATLVAARVEPMLDDLEKRQVITIANEAAITSQARPHLAALLAAQCVADAVSPDLVLFHEAQLRSLARLDAAAGTVLSRAVLARLETLGLSANAVDTTAVAAAIQEVLDDLTRRRIVGFANDGAVESGARPHVVTLVAARVHPKAVPPEAAAAAEAALLRIARLSRTSGFSAITSAVLDRLEAVGMASSPLDSSAVTAKIQPVLDRLAAERVITLANAAAVADKHFDAVVTLVTHECQPKAVSAEDVTAARAALLRIDRLNRAASTAFVRAVLERLDVLGASTLANDATAVSGHVQAVLDDLAANRVVAVANEASIASAQYEHVLTLVAARAEPKAVPQEAVARAWAALRRAARLSRTTGTALERAILERLEAVDAGTDAIDLTAVTAAIQRTLDDLAARRVIRLANDAAVLPQHFPHIVTLVTALCLPKAVAAADVVAAEAGLAAIARLDRTASTAFIRGVLEQIVIWGASSPAVDATTVSGRLQGILDNLTARNVIYITDADSIPDGALDPLTRYVAARLSPQTPAGALAEAERGLRLIDVHGPTYATLAPDYY